MAAPARACSSFCRWDRRTPARSTSAFDRSGFRSPRGRMISRAAITLDRVTKVYDEPVVSDISLEVPQGSFVTLVGPSGSGKTTILQMIGGFVQPTAGRILFGGADMTSR